MPEETYEQKKLNYAVYLAERNKLIDAARESSRTFDQAVLAFGSAVFAASVAFLKDVAPKPLPATMPWLRISWLCFTFGLLASILSFLLSHKTCLVRIEDAGAQLNDPQAKPKADMWANRTTLCNWLCVALLFVGVLAWLVFAFRNLTIQGGK